MGTGLFSPVVALKAGSVDDSVDRVIGEVHFGKKWKHYARTAQQHLKRRGEIEFDGARWHLTQGV